MASISDLSECAARHLSDYTDKTGPRSFHTYDRIGDPDRFEPYDALMPALLNATVSYDHVNAMFSDDTDNSYNTLRLAIDRLLATTSAIPTPEESFLTIDLTDPDGPWSRFRECLRASDATSGIKAVTVSKMLHRKRPHLVPIIDSVVATYYGCTTTKPWDFWPVFQADLQTHADLLRAHGTKITTPDGRAVSSLRIADIVIWEHCVTDCARTSEQK